MLLAAATTLLSEPPDQWVPDGTAISQVHAQPAWPSARDGSAPSPMMVAAAQWRMVPPALARAPALSALVWLVRRSLWCTAGPSASSQDCVLLPGWVPSVYSTLHNCGGWVGADYVACQEVARVGGWCPQLALPPLWPLAGGKKFRLQRKKIRCILRLLRACAWARPYCGRLDCAWDWRAL